MAYEYERINSIGCVTSAISTDQAVEELKEVYRKAKAFDEILKIDNQATDEDRITGKYESDIETVLSEYMEHANDD